MSIIKKLLLEKVIKLKANGNGNSNNSKLVSNIKFILTIKKSVYLKIINIKTLNDIKYAKSFFLYKKFVKKIIRKNY